MGGEIHQPKRNCSQTTQPLERTAYDVPELHHKLEGYSDEELKRIPVLRAGSQLDEGAIYIDLGSEQPEEFTAPEDLVTLHQNWYVPKSRVDCPLWNRLIRVTEPQHIAGGRA